MSIVVNLYYTGKNGAARAFADEMTSSGIAEKVRAEKGNLRYEYFIPLSYPETVLLIDCWEDGEALDRHHESPLMAEIAALREKYDLTVRAERFLPDSENISEKDKEYLKTRR